MNVASAIRSLFLQLISLTAITLAAQVFIVPWDTASFGPDGPWQAVKITLGGNDSTKYINFQNVTEVSVYPGGSWSSNTFTKAACEEYPDSLCGAGGTWDPDPDQLLDQKIQFREPWVIDESGLNVPDMRHIALGLTIGGKTVWNATLGTFDTGNITYPNGRVGGIPLGQLSLGATKETAQEFTTSDLSADAIKASMFAGQLYKDKEIPSYSYGLHIGSAAFNYPGSLAFGGYNKGRVIGPVISFVNDTWIDLLDIGIGVEFGASPFSFDAKDNLLSTEQTKAKHNALSPYISLPRKTCDNIAKLLPVTYDSDLKYYLWDVNDPLYSKIVSSPAFLSFKFAPAAGESDNVAIKVPFALLNLTLEHPITDSPRQYFPCVPYEGSPVLGRAFLQAAFLGRNWNSGMSWLAQAPGPGAVREGLGEQYVDIADADKIIEGFQGQSLFNQSWQGHWSIIASKSTSDKPEETKDTQPQDAKSPDASEGHDSEGLSTGAKAGIGVGAAVGAAVLVGLSIWFWRRWSTAQKGSTATLSRRDEKFSDQINPQGYDTGTNEHRYELPEHVSVEPVEVPDTNVPYTRS
ncbi:hypothetical protein P171DRAFT_433574 [Karstenula rhodostoma CBS 690.94]|uniref:Acid protease n=1 Tax=Karstenula rhodostoma CBS 690.94 TaxID=1392251 RepID=A0A9P4PEP8_9PLEO|nr:hypothetical protein P171DRAFT_433574 [Karstenula rhodostoma CBS 690.94]